MVDVVFPLSLCILRRHRIVFKHGKVRRHSDVFVFILILVLYFTHVLLTFDRSQLAHFAQEADHYILEHGSILITDRDRCLFPLSDVDDAAYRRMYSRNIKMVLQTMCFLLEESMIDYHDVSNLIIAIGCGKSPLFYLAEELVESDNYDIFLANFIDAAKNGLGEIPSTISDHIGSAYDATSTILQRWKLRFQEKIGLRHAIAADDPILRLATEKYLGGDFNDEDFYRLLWPLFRQPQHSPELVFRHLTGR